MSAADSDADSEDLQSDLAWAGVSEDAECERLFTKLRTQIIEDGCGAPGSTRRLLKHLLKETRHFLQKERYKQRGFSSAEALPVEVIERIVSALADLDSTGYKKHALISKNFSRVVRAKAWETVDSPKAGTLRVVEEIAPAVAPYIRRIECRSSSKEGRHLACEASKLKALWLLVWSPSSLGAFFRLFTLQNGRSHLEDLMLKARNKCPAFEGQDPFCDFTWSTWPALRRVTLQGLSARPKTWRILTFALCGMTNLTDLAVVRCHDIMTDDTEGRVVAQIEDYRPAESFDKLTHLFLENVAINSDLGAGLLLLAAPCVRVVEVVDPFDRVPDRMENGRYEWQYSLDSMQKLARSAPFKGGPLELLRLVNDRRVPAGPVADLLLSSSLDGEDVLRFVDVLALLEIPAIPDLVLPTVDKAMLDVSPDTPGYEDCRAALSRVSELAALCGKETRHVERGTEWLPQTSIIDWKWAE